jgi:ribosomal protein RSM22 (predicted rRNA methylase)
VDGYDACVTRSVAVGVLISKDRVVARAELLSRNAVRFIAPPRRRAGKVCDGVCDGVMV